MIRPYLMMRRNKLQMEIKDLNRKLKEEKKIKKLFIIKILQQQENYKNL